MEGQCRSSQKYLLLHVWCGLLTMALVIMAAFIASIKPKSEQVSNSDPHISHFMFKTLTEDVWTTHVACESCSLSLLQNCIYFNSSSHERSHFFFYAQVVFRKNLTHNLVMLIRNASEYAKKDERILVRGGSATVEGVWLGKMVTLTGGDSVRLNITGEYSRTHSFWGAFQLH
uniref:TNF family profile domain-containing protein n=1 Tax=Poecilia latipinna TaxID=48699 RepID=A0A3B3UKS5_9TELE